MLTTGLPIQKSRLCRGLYCLVRGRNAGISDTVSICYRKDLPSSVWGSELGASALGAVRASPKR